MPKLRSHNRLLWVTGLFHVDKHAVTDIHAANGYRRTSSMPVVYSFDAEDMSADRAASNFRERFDVSALADNECEHGRLPGDPGPSCTCYTMSEEARLLLVPENVLDGFPKNLSRDLPDFVGEKIVGTGAIGRIIFLMYFPRPPWHCEICGEKILHVGREGRDVLHVHHSNENVSDNRLINLVPLHSSCHLSRHKRLARRGADGGFISSSEDCINLHTNGNGSKATPEVD